MLTNVAHLDPLHVSVLTTVYESVRSAAYGFAARLYATPTIMAGMGSLCGGPHTRGGCPFGACSGTTPRTAVALTWPAP